MTSTHSRTVSVAVVALAIFATVASAPRRTSASLVFEFVKDRLQTYGVQLSVGADGHVYGTTTGRDRPFGQPPTDPIVFRIDAAGAFTTLHTLAYGNEPSALVLGADHALYGTMYQGVLLRVDQQGIVTSTPLSIPFPYNGGAIGKLVLGSDGEFYSTVPEAYENETQVFYGSVVKITTAGGVTGLGGHLGYHVAIPFVVGSDGAVYGSRGEQDGRGGTGSIIRWDAAGQHSVLHQYTQQEATGLTPSAFALGSDGFLYATTPFAGIGNGAIFKFDNAGTVAWVHSLDGSTDGASPHRVLTLGSDGAMYGVANFGGANGFGTLFRIDSVGVFSVVHAFDSTDGGAPGQELFLARDGSLYGNGVFGTPGAAVFRVDPAGAFTASPVIPADYWPASQMVQGSDCALYGVLDTYDDAAVAFDKSIYRVFEPGQLCHRIAFGPLADVTLGDPRLTISGTASSTLPVSFTASGSCEVDGDQVTLTGPGRCTLTASQEGDKRYQPAAEVSQSFDVLFDFTGFLRPVRNPPVVNRVQAGRTVPIRFSLGGDQGRVVLAEGSPSVRSVPCDAAAPVNDIEGLITKRLRSLLHASSGDRYTHLWKTDKNWAGTCQELSLELIDGSVHQASFRFERAHLPRGNGR